MNTSSYENCRVLCENCKNLEHIQQRPQCFNADEHCRHNTLYCEKGQLWWIRWWDTNRQSWILGEAAQAHWVQGCAPEVAAEPLQNERLATALPTGNVSNPAIWKRFKLEGTSAQSQCLGTQLSVPFFFQAPCTEQKTLTCILKHRKTAWECTEEWRKTTPVLADLYYQPTPEDKDTTV